MLDIKTLESWLWEAACKIRGEIDAPKYKEYILPIIFLKRLSDVFDDEFNKLAEAYEDEEEARQFIEADHSLVWFYLPEDSRWEKINSQSSKLGEFLTDAVRAIARENPKLQGVIDFIDFNATTAGRRVISDDKLKLLINTLGKHRLGTKDVEPDILGRAYEYLLRKFAEGSGQSAGEFYTPKEVAILMARILDPKEGEEVYDPCLGSGGLLIKTYLRFREKFGDDSKIKPLKFYGQEDIHATFAMAKMNAFIHQMHAEIALGNTMTRPAFLEKQGALKKFNIVVANPMWNQDFPTSIYETDTYNRFGYGIAPASTADWGWIQHMFTSLKDKGRMAVILDTGSVSRGSGNKGANKERDIRKKFIEDDFIEAVILFPGNCFYNTPAPGVIIIINRDKKKKDKVLLINASKLYKKGRPKNYLPEETIEKVSTIYSGWKEEEGVSMVLDKDELVANDFNLSPSRFISQNGEDDTLPLNDAVVLVKEAEEERKEADEKINAVLDPLNSEFENTNQETYVETDLGNFPKDWTIESFEDCVEKKRIKVGKVQKQEFKKMGDFPIVDQGQSNIAGYWDEKEDVYQGELPVIIFGDHTRALKFIDFRFVCGADGTKVIVPNKNKVDPLFFYYALLNLDIPSRGYNRHYSILKEQRLVLPSIPEQKKIAHILSIISNSIEKSDNFKCSLNELKKSTLQNLMGAKTRVDGWEI
jgi:type I restriction enzyme M protein